MPVRHTIGFLLITAVSAQSAELCVSCVEPAAIYRCDVEGVAQSSARDTGAQLLCVTELAKTGKHKSCAVERGASEVCSGALIVVRRETAPAIAAREAEAVGPVEMINVPAEPEVVATPPADQPKTAGETLTEAGEAVGDAAKKTWHCFTSFLTDC